MMEVSAAEFDDMIADAMDLVPEELADLMTNVAVFAVDHAPYPNLLGLYEGVPLTERTHSYAGVLPDRISIYRDTITRICSTRDEVVREVAVTVVHEIAHHFGIDDEWLHSHGY